MPQLGGIHAHIFSKGCDVYWVIAEESADVKYKFEFQFRELLALFFIELLHFITANIEVLYGLSSGLAVTMQTEIEVVSPRHEAGE